MSLYTVSVFLPIESQSSQSQSIYNIAIFKLTVLNVDERKSSHYGMFLVLDDILLHCGSFTNRP